MALKRRVLVLAPFFVTSEEAVDIKNRLSVYLWKDTEIDVTSVKENVGVNSVSESEFATPEFLDLAIKAEKSKYNAIISYCYCDVGVDAARELLNIPVLGPMETSAIIANILAKKFSIISVGATQHPAEFYNLPRLRSLGIDKNYVSSRGIDFTKYFVLTTDPEKLKLMINALFKECEKALADGAHALILGCTGLPSARTFSERFKGVPVIDIAVVVKMAEALIDLKVNCCEPAGKYHQTLSHIHGSQAKMKIKWLIPFSSKNPNLIEKLKMTANDETQIDVIKLEHGPKLIKSYADIAKVVQDVIREAANAEKEGYNALIVHSFTDVGLEAAKEVCNIPVLGLGETSMLLSCLLGMKIAVFTYNAQSIKLIERIVMKKGLEKRVLWFYPFKKASLKSNLDNLVHQIQKVVSMGAQVVIIDEIDDYEIFESLRLKTECTVLDPAFATLKVAETLHSVGLSHSKLSYPKPLLPEYHKKRLEGLVRKPTKSMFLYA